MPRVMRASWHNAARPLRMTWKLRVGHHVEGHRNRFGLKRLYDATLCVSSIDYSDTEVKISDGVIYEHWAAQKYRVDEMLPAGMPGPVRAKLFQALVTTEGLGGRFKKVYNGRPLQERVQRKKRHNHRATFRERVLWQACSRGVPDEEARLRVEADQQTRHRDSSV